MGSRSREKFIASSSGLPIIPYGPGMQYANEAAVIAAFPVGTPVYDMAETVEANRMKRIRYVAELNGPDFLTIFPPNADLRNNDWEASFIFCDKALDESLPSILLDGFAGASRVLSAVILANGSTISFTLRDGTNAVAAIGIIANFGDGKHHIFTIRKSGLTLYVSTDLTSKQSVSIPGTWSGLGYTSFRLSDSTISLRPLQVANYKAKLNGTAIDLIPCDEASGLALANSATPARPATLSDATAHAKTCVPLSLGG